MNKIFKEIILYSYHSKSLYPVSGEGIYSLERGPYNVLGAINKFGEKEGIKIMRNRNYSEKDIAEGLKVWRILNHD